MIFENAGVPPDLPFDGRPFEEFFPNLLDAGISALTSGDVSTIDAFLDTLSNEGQNPVQLQPACDEVPNVGDLQQAADIQETRGCTSTATGPVPQSARICPSRRPRGPPRRRTKLLPKYFDESSSEFGEFVYRVLQVLAGNKHREADPGMDPAVSWSKIGMHGVIDPAVSWLTIRIPGSCTEVPVFRKGWLNSRDWQWMHSKAMQDARDGSRPLQEMFACLLYEGAEHGTKKPNIGGPMSGRELEWQPVIKTYAGSRDFTGRTLDTCDRQWTFAATHYTLKSDSEQKSGKRRRTDVGMDTGDGKEWAVYVLSEATRPEQSSSPKNGSDRTTASQKQKNIVTSVQPDEADEMAEIRRRMEMCRIAQKESDMKLHHQRNIKRFLAAIMMGGSFTDVQAAGQKCCWTTIIDFFGELRLSWRPLHLAVIRASEDDREGMQILDYVLQASFEAVQQLFAVDDDDEAMQLCFAALDDDECTPLHTAAKHGNVQVIQNLLDRGSHCVINAIPKSGWGPIHVAAHNGHREALELLLTHRDTRGEVLVCDGPVSCRYYTGKPLLDEVARKFCFQQEAEGREDYSPPYGHS